jgi:plexin B
MSALSVSCTQGRRFVYASSNTRVVQAPLAFCGKHSSCEDCVLARDPYCAWSLPAAACVTPHQAEGPSR